VYVCICNALTERQVDGALAQGAKKVGDVYAQLACSPQCGKCVRDVKERLAARGDRCEGEALVQLGR
jgi:bacterioferritin-associated ferredoxin